MFTRIILNDFQCHKYLDLALERITTLVGTSDAGKSACVRAIDWAVFNRGTASTLVRRNSDNASVIIEVDGHSVERFSKGNGYRLDGILFSSINKTIPAEVTNIFRMSEDNIQRQHDHLYWFTANGSTLTSNLNTIVDLSKLEGWISNGKSIERKYSDRVKYLQERVNELDAERTKLARFRAIDFQLTKLEEQEKQIAETKERHAALQEWYAQYIDNKHKIELRHALIAKISAMLLKMKQYFEERERASVLSTFTKNINEIQERLERHKSIKRVDVDGILNARIRYGNLVTLLGSLVRTRGKVNNHQIMANAWQDVSAKYERFLADKKRYEDLRRHIFISVPQKPEYAVKILGDAFGYRIKYDGLLQTISVLNKTKEAIRLSKEAHHKLEEEFKSKADVCPLCGTMSRTYRNHLESISDDDYNEIVRQQDDPFDYPDSERNDGHLNSGFLEDERECRSTSPVRRRLCGMNYW